MSNHVYKMVEYAGSSPKSIDDAIRNAVAKASKESPKLRWFQLVETRGQIENGEVAHWQVVVKIGATLE
jgi:flavin-binding protein dodecin